MNIPTSADLTRNAFASNRVTDDYRPLPAGAYPVGTLLQFVAQDFQQYPDYRTVQPSPAVANQLLLAGVVAEEMRSTNSGGFDGQGSTTSGAASARGSQIIPTTIFGYHGAVLIDNTGGNAISNGTALSSSATTAGRAQGNNAPVATAVLGNAALPSAGVGATLGTGVPAQASQTITVGGVPAVGDVYTITLQIPYNQNYPGIVQTRAVVVGPLNAGQAASVTAAAAAIVAAIQADAVASKYYTASNAAGVVTVAANANAVFPIYFANAFNANVGLPINITPFGISLSGSAANGLTIAGVKTVNGGGGTATITAGGGALAGGSGFIGQAPAWITLF